uniref:Zinc finger protein 720 n=1 Tax=Piliocolobus tephrosceles TaxID=591936 RepID=A0A8C9I1U3_9PRIM
MFSFTERGDKEEKPSEEKIRHSLLIVRAPRKARIRVQLRRGNSRKREIHSMDNCQDRAGHRQGHEPKLQKDCLTLEKKLKASDTVHISEMRRPMMPAVGDPERPTLGTVSDPDLSL